MRLIPFASGDAHLIAEYIAWLFYNIMVSNFDIPKIIVSDGCPNYKYVLENTMEIIGDQTINILTFSPANNRVNTTCKPKYIGIVLS